MVLPCDTCKRKTVKRSGHRVFIGCNDPELQRENFKEDTYLTDSFFLRRTLGVETFVFMIDSDSFFWRKFFGEIKGFAF